MARQFLRLAQGLFLRAPSDRDRSGGVGARVQDADQGTGGDDIEARLRRAFTDIESHLRRRLRRVLGNAADVDEVTQDTYLQAWERRHTIRDQDPRGFLLRTGGNLAIDRKRRDTHRPVAIGDELLEMIVPDAITPERLLIARRDLEAVQAAIEKLPAAQRRALDMSDEGKTLAEIAAALGCGSTHAWRQLHAAYAALHAARLAGGAPNKKRKE